MYLYVYGISPFYDHYFCLWHEFWRNLSVSLYIYIYMFIYIYLCKYVCVYMYVFTFMYHMYKTYLHIYTWVYVYVCGERERDLILRERSLQDPFKMWRWCSKKKIDCFSKSKSPLASDLILIAHFVSSSVLGPGNLEMNSTDLASSYPLGWPTESSK